MYRWKKAIALVLGLAVFHLPSAIAEPGTASPVWITSWNAYSKQFIHPPVFRVLPLLRTAEYRAVVRQNDRTWTISSRSPTLSLAKIWPGLIGRSTT
jgi:hypothetical protein